MSNPNIIIGWQEWVSLPDLGVPVICAKTDTGAKTSSIHAYHIQIYNKQGIEWVRFELHPLQRNKRIKLQCSAPVHDVRKVKSSNGEVEERPVILTPLSIGGKEWVIELNLTNRDYMGCRMLIGREAMGNKVMINPSNMFLHGKISKKDAKKEYEDFSK